MLFTLYSRGDQHSAEICDQISQSLTDNGWTRNDTEPDLVICVGGDGTLLRAIHHYLERLENTRFVGVHTGTLGFLTDYTADELDQFLHDVLHNPCDVESSPLMEMSTDNSPDLLYALNDIRIGSWSESVQFDIFIDDEFFETTSGSGICICTQAGSSAANRTLGGAVVDSGIRMMELTEIMPMSHKSHHSLRNPYIMKCDRVLTIVPKRYFPSLNVSYDHITEINSDTMRFVVRQSAKTVQFARFRPYSYLKRLKNLY